MGQYIDKDKLEAFLNELRENLGDSDFDRGYLCAINSIFGCYLNSTEVKEVDLEEELESFAYTLPHSAIGDGEHLGKFDDPKVKEARKHGWSHLWRYNYVKEIAKHFFELGMRVNNPITAADRGTAEEIIINLKRVEQDYHIDLTKEMEWLRNKVNERNVMMEQPLISQSDCESCKLYEGFGQCFEHGYNLVENCKDYKKGEAYGIVDKLPLPEKCRACIWGPLTCHFVGTCNNFDRFRKREG